MPPGTNTIKAALLFFGLLVVTFSPIVACSALEDNYMNPNSDSLVGYPIEKQIEALVINEWRSMTKGVVQLQILNGQDHYTFSDYGKLTNVDEGYWGSVNPTMGNCVKVWASLRPKKSGKEHVLVLFNDRNLTPCKN